MAKLTEKQLFTAWLDIKYANGLYEDIVHDLEIELKAARQGRNKARRLLKKAAEHYESIYGKEPRESK